MNAAVMTMLFDTLAYSKKLREAGVPEPIAEAQAEALREIVVDQLATKKDLTDLEMRLTNKIEQMGYKLTIRLGSMIAAGILILSTLIKLHS